MPSDDRLVQVTAALAGPAETFRTAIATTLEQVRTILAAQVSSTEGRRDRFEAELGPFASGRIDPERFATLVVSDNGTFPGAVEPIERASEALAGLLAGHDEMLHVPVPVGDDLRDVMASHLGRLGTAFGAARVVDLARSDRYREAEHVSLLEAFPFERWNSGERAVAPPLIVEVDGNDFRPAGLADFLDGSQKIVLIVRGDCPPAGLVRLVSPRIFVLQSADGEGLDRLVAWKGAGIAALVPDSAAQFLHDPEAGDELEARLTVNYVPDRAPRRTVAGLSATQQQEELAQLAVLGRAGAARSDTAAVRAAKESADPADKLAAWLLRQAELPDTS